MHPPPADFLRAVEQAFLQAHGRGLMLSARDVDRVLRWHTAGYPLHIVVDAITTCMAEAPPRVRGLAYAAAAVEDAVGAWRARQVGAREGGDDGAPPDTLLDPAAIRSAFEALLARLERAGRQQTEGAYLGVLREAWRQVRDLGARCAVHPELDPVEALAEVEHRIEALALDTLPVDVRVVVEAKVDVALAAERRVAPPDDFARTRQAQVWRAVRRRVGLPPLVLALEGEDE